MFQSSYFFNHLHLPPLSQEKCQLGIQPLSTYHYLHYCCNLYHLHIPQFQQGECHLGIHPLFPHHILFYFHFFLNYIFLHLNNGSFIQEYWLFILILFYLFLSSFLSFTPFYLSIGEVSSQNYASLVFFLARYAILGSVPFLFCVKLFYLCHIYEMKFFLLSFLTSPS